MSRSLNKVTLIGNLGNDPEVRSTTGGNRVATFSLATSRSWNDAYSPVTIAVMYVEIGTVAGNFHRPPSLCSGVVFESDSSVRRPAAAAPKAKAAAAGGEDFEDFPNALADEDDDLPF